MASFNRVIIAGHLCRDHELRNLPNGDAVISNSVAINSKWKDKEGEAKERTDFVDITAFGKMAETMAEYQKKGDPVLLEGKLRQETWTDKESDAKRSKLKVIVDSFQFLARSNGEGGEQTEREERPAARNNKPATGKRQQVDNPTEDNEGHRERDNAEYGGVCPF